MFEMLTSIICSLLGDRKVIRVHPPNRTPPTTTVLVIIERKGEDILLTVNSSHCQSAGRGCPSDRADQVGQRWFFVQKLSNSTANKEMALSEEEVKACLHKPDPSTKDFIMQQTMLRVKDPKVSLDFYTRILGMRFVSEDSCALTGVRGGRWRTNSAPKESEKLEQTVRKWC